jgi:predicted  nucleic acid-binding Zn-ribbon protein
MICTKCGKEFAQEWEENVCEECSDASTRVVEWNKEQSDHLRARLKSVEE